MSNSDKIKADPLFLGLTRPPMIFGVSYKLAALNMLSSLLTFIVTSDFFYLLVLMPSLHGAFYLLCLKEPRAIELLIAKSSKCSICKNKSNFNGANSYDLY
jgi:type IV secretion system protein VirB3